MKLMHTIIMIIVIPTLALAYDNNDYRAFAKEAQKREGALIAPFMNELALKNKATSLKGKPIMPTEEPPVKQLVLKSQKNRGSILIFVSFSMPKESLVALVRDAKKIHASVILRGLVDNSFKKTLPLISAIVKEAGGGGIEINPIAFSDFNIQSVPTVVSISTTHDNSFDAVSGDVPLTYALKALSEKGESGSNTAKGAYLALKEGQHA